MLAAEGIAQAFPQIVTGFLENPLIGFVELLEKVAEVGKEVFNQIGEFADHALKTSFDAAKAGVGTEFLSGLEEAGKRVDVSSQAIGDGLKFMNRNAVEALQGSQEAAHGFSSLGISMQFLHDHLNDSEAIFAAVHQGLQQLPTAAERTRAAMEVMGRGGSELIPILSMTSEQLDNARQTAGAFGALVGDDEVTGAKAWREASVEISEMGEGLLKLIATPVLKTLADHGDELKTALLSVTAILADLIPAALAKMAEGFEFVLELGRGLADIMLPVAQLIDRIGLTSGAADFNRAEASILDAGIKGAGTFASSSQQVGEEIGRAVRAELARSGGPHQNPNVDVQVNIDGTRLGAGAALHTKVARSLGTKRHYNGGF